MTKLKGSTTDHLYYWDRVYGWVHISEVKKLKEAYERFKEDYKEELDE